MKKLIILVIVFLLSTCRLLQDETHAFPIYDWVPVLSQGGTGFITLNPLGTEATDSDFTSSTVIDFQFTFDNGVPTVNLSDLDTFDLIGNIVIPKATAGILSDFVLYQDPDAPPIPFQQEINYGAWILRPDTQDTTPIPDPQH